MGIGKACDISVKQDSMKRANWRVGAALLAAVLPFAGLTPQLVYAETYPNKTITIVVPLAAGGAVDAVARLIQPGLAQALGQTVIVVDRPGASGLLGTSEVARSRPDGSTILLTPSTFAVDPAVNLELPYDVERDFQPIAVVASNSMLFVVNPKLPVHSLADFVKLAKESPGKMNYATPGVYSQARLLIEMWSSEAGIKLQQVPFKGAAPAVLSLVAGDTQMTLASPLVVLSQIKGGTLRAIAAAGRTRDAHLPGLPTTVEAGYPDLVANQWIGALVANGTPPDIVAKLNTAINTALKDKNVRERLAQQGGKAVGGTSEEFKSLIASDLAMWKKIARDAKIIPH
jgi:tripartite-type tricarboxylate transporter receptor subunit TctC